MAAPTDNAPGTPDTFLLPVKGLKGRKHLTIYPAANPTASPSTLFIPGMRGHAGTYSTLVPSGNFLAGLAEAGLNVVAVDLPGHGQSEGPRGLFTYHSIIETLRAAVAYTAERFGTPVGVTGSSMGGILSLYAALEIPEIQAAAPMNVLDLRNIDPALHLLRHRIIVPPTRMLARMGAGPLLTWAPVPVDAFLSTKEVWDDTRYAHGWLSDPLSTSSYRTSAWISVFMTPDDKPPLESLTTPTRILVGERDKVLPAGMTRAIYARLACEKDLIVLPDAGHMLPIAYHGQSVPLVAEWLLSHLAVRPAQTAPETPPAENGQDAPATFAWSSKRAAPRQPKKNEGA